jgi:hypothetical protein
MTASMRELERVKVAEAVTQAQLKPGQACGSYALRGPDSTTPRADQVFLFS